MARHCQNPFSSVSERKNTPSCGLKDPIRYSVSASVSVSTWSPPSPDNKAQFAVPVIVPSSVNSSVRIFLVSFDPREFKVMLLEVHVPLRTVGSEKLAAIDFSAKETIRQARITAGIELYLNFI